MQSTIGERLKAVEQYLNDDEEFFATYGDGLTDAPLDRMLDAFRASGKLIQFLSVRPQFNAHRVITDDDGHGHVRRGHEPLRRAHQRRLLRVPPRAARLDRAGRRARRGDVREADPARRGGRVPVRRVLRADGHDQGPTAPRGAARVRAARPGVRSASATTTSRGPPDARALPLERRHAAASACSRSAATPTTSRSAAVGRCSHCCAQPPGHRGDVGRARRRGSPGETRRGRAPRSSSRCRGALEVVVHGFRDAYHAVLTPRRSRRCSRSSSASSPISCSPTRATTSTRTTGSRASSRGTRSATTSSSSTRCRSGTAISDDPTSTSRSTRTSSHDKLELVLRHFPTPGRRSTGTTTRPSGAHATPWARVRRAVPIRRGVLRREGGGLAMRRSTRVRAWDVVIFRWKRGSTP